MGDIFISYAREDRQAAERVAEALKGNGWSVWWDPEISPGDIWDELIERELANVCCVVVLWSATSIHKQWVKAEAAEANTRGILVPVLIENVKPPLAFRQIQAAPLADWRGERDHAGFQQLLCTICKLVGSGRLCNADSTSASAGRRRAMPEDEVELVAPQRSSTKPAPHAPAEPELASLRSANGWRRLTLPRGRRTVVGGAAALLLLGGMIGYALNDGVKRLSAPPSSTEIVEQATPPGCAPERRAEADLRMQAAR